MIIQWLGQSCFKIQTKNNQVESIVCLDPFADSAGLKMSRFQADIATCSSNDDKHNNVEALRGEPFVAVNPGEYETRSVFIYGIPAVLEKTKSKMTIFKVISEDVAIVHLGDLSQTLTDDQIDKIGNADVLLMPVDSIDSKKAAEVIAQIDPRIVVPMDYKSNDKSALDSFIKNSGLKSETMDKLKVAKKDLMAEDTRIIVLTI